MTERYTKMTVMDNDIVMEGLMDIGLSLPIIPAKKYVELAVEAISLDGSNASLIHNLYLENQKIKEVNTNNVPLSKGDITKYKYYVPMAQSLEILTNLQGEDEGEVIKLANTLHKLIIARTEDFEHGFKHNKSFLSDFYTMTVLCLFELIDIGVIETTAVLKAKITRKESKSSSATKAMKKFVILHQAQNAIKILNSSNWNEMMKTVTKIESDKIREAMATPASESVMSKTLEAFEIKHDENGISFSGQTNATGFMKGPLKGLAGFIKKGSGEDPVKATPQGAKDWFGKLNFPMKALLVIIGMMLSTRFFVRYFIKASNHINNYAKTQAALIKHQMDVDRNAGKNTPKMHAKTLDFLEGLSDTIEHKILRTEKETVKDIKAANEEVFGTQVVVNGNSGNKFELL